MSQHCHKTTVTEWTGSCSTPPAAEQGNHRCRLLLFSCQVSKVFLCIYYHRHLHELYQCWLKVSPERKKTNPTAEQLKGRGEKNGYQILMLKDLAYYSFWQHWSAKPWFKKQMFSKRRDTIFWKCSLWSISCHFGCFFG